MAKPFLSIVILARNNARTLPLALIDADHHLGNREAPYEIIVVDGGSRDKTFEIAERFSPLVKNLKVLGGGAERGLGLMIREGLAASRGKWCMLLSGTSSVSAAEFYKVLPHLESGYDLAIGSRFMPHSSCKPRLHIHQSLFRMLHNLFTRFLALPKIKDTESGLLCISEGAVSRIAPFLKIDSAGGAMEVAALAHKLGFKIKEFPIFWENNSRFDYKHYFEVLRDAFRVRWMMFQDKYKIKN